MKNRLRIVVVDDHPLFRRGVLHALAVQPDMVVVQQGGTSDDAVRIARDYLPDVLMLDLNIPGDALCAIGTIASQHPTVSILVLTGIADDLRVASAMRKGARGCLLKETSGHELVEALQVLALGGSYISPRFGGRSARTMAARPHSKDAERAQVAALSLRETQILSLVSVGLSNKEIGSQLGLAEKTVKHYLTSVMRKCHARNRVQAALTQFH
jgi:two-component system nitrate/nitrite response regulator NarL